MVEWGPERREKGPGWRKRPRDIAFNRIFSISGLLGYTENKEDSEWGMKRIESDSGGEKGHLIYAYSSRHFSSVWSPRKI